MSENKKFTEQELKDIKTLRDSYASKVTEFGQVELEFLAVKSRKELLETTKETLKKEYTELQEKERSLVENLNKKYGAGTVDLSNGEFIPAKW